MSDADFPPQVWFTNYTPFSYSACDETGSRGWYIDEDTGERVEWENDITSLDALRFAGSGWIVDLIEEQQDANKETE